MNVPTKGHKEEQIQKYQEMLRSGETIKPIKVRKVQNGKYYLKDGSHRIEAHKRHTIRSISAEITF